MPGKSRNFIWGGLI